jgi:hypothetical protein
MATRAYSQISSDRIPRTLVAGLLLLAATSILLYRTIESSAGPTVAVVWGSVTLVAYCAALLCLLGASQGPGLGLVHWKLGPWIALWYGLAFGAASATWAEPQTTGVTAEIAVSNVLHAGETDWGAIVASMPAILCVWLLSVAVAFRVRGRS